MRRSVFGSAPWLSMGLLAASITVACGAPAYAAWSLAATGSSAGAAAVMPTGSTPTGSAIGGSVTLDWSAVTFPNGRAVAGYVINRYSTATGLPATVGSDCAGIVTTTTCTENSVPPGTWFYTDTPVQINWTGGQSADSASITVP
jgi:hypothetical protein